jgi:AcrR family transcriptional regulator
MTKQSRSASVMQTVLDAVAERLMTSDEIAIRIPEICEATGVNYGSVYHHFGSREGVIDATYDMMFTTMAEQDVASLKLISHAAQSFEEYVASLQGVIGTFASGPERRARRAIRVRIIAAAMTRPDLKERIGNSQIRITAELAHLVEYGQERGWLRHDMPAHSIAVIVQVLLVGRTVDDISMQPIDDDEWSTSMQFLLSDLVSPQRTAPTA